ADLHTLRERDPESSEISRTTIRIIAALSSLAISDHEPNQPGTEDAVYHSLLLRERNALRELLVRGAKLQAVLLPPTRYAPHTDWRRLDIRFKRLISLLKGSSDISSDPAQAKADRTAMENCVFAVTSVPHPNTLILGNAVA